MGKIVTIASVTVVVVSLGTGARHFYEHGVSLIKVYRNVYSKYSIWGLCSERVFGCRVRVTFA